MSPDGPETEVTTERLRCRRPAAGDLGTYARVLQDPEVEPWLRPPPMRPFDGFDLGRMLDRDRDHWERHGWGPWVLEGLDRPGAIGRGGLGWTRVDGDEAIELAWAISPQRQRDGLATEMGRAALDLADQLGITEVVSFTLVDNTASRRVMEKLGFSEFREIEHVGLPHVIGRTVPGEARR